MAAVFLYAVAELGRHDGLTLRGNLSVSCCSSLV